MNEIKIFHNHSSQIINKKSLKDYVSKILHYKGYDIYSISLIFVDEEKLKDMKNQYFKQTVIR